MTWSRENSSWDFVLFPAIIALSCIAAWGLSNWFLSLITEFSYWGELRKLPSHSMDIPTNLSATDCRILTSQGSARDGFPIGLHGRGRATGVSVWIVEQGLILRFLGWKLWLADHFLGMLRISKICCDVERRDPDHFIVWMQVGPPARPPIRVGVELLRLDRQHIEMLDQWNLEQGEKGSRPPSAVV